MGYPNKTDMAETRRRSLYMRMVRAALDHDGWYDLKFCEHDLLAAMDAQGHIEFGHERVKLTEAGLIHYATTVRGLLFSVIMGSTEQAIFLKQYIQNAAIHLTDAQTDTLRQLDAARSSSRQVISARVLNDNGLNQLVDLGFVLAHTNDKYAITGNGVAYLRLMDAAMGEAS